MLDGFILILNLRVFGRLDVYIHDYLLKRKLHASAKAFMAEGKVATDPVGMLAWVPFISFLCRSLVFPRVQSFVSAEDC